MKIERELIERISLAEFADRHDLVLTVTERSTQRIEGVERFFARFRRVDITDGAVLTGAFGNGNTEDEAIANYAARISEQRLVVDAFKEDKRREIMSPKLSWEEQDDG